MKEKRKDNSMVVLLRKKEWAVSALSYIPKHEIK